MQRTCMFGSTTQARTGDGKEEVRVLPQRIDDRAARVHFLDSGKTVCATGELTRFHQKKRAKARTDLLEGAATRGQRQREIPYSGKLGE